MTEPTTTEINGTIVSLIRTVVPVFVGLALSWLARQGLDFDSEPVVGAVNIVVIAIYYAAVRMVGNRYPAAEWALGHPAPPQYNK